MKSPAVFPHQSPLPTWMRRAGRGWLAFALLAAVICLLAGRGVAGEESRQGTPARPQLDSSASESRTPGPPPAGTVTIIRKALWPACCSRPAPIPGRNPANPLHHPRELFHIWSLGRRDHLKVFGLHALPAPGSPTLFTLGVLLRP